MKNYISFTLIFLISATLLITSEANQQVGEASDRDLIDESRKLILDSYNANKLRLIRNLIIENNDAFKNVMSASNMDMKALIENKKAYHQLQSYLFTYCKAEHFFKSFSPKMNSLIISFTNDYWNIGDCIDQVGESKTECLDAFIKFLKNKVEERTLERKVLLDFEVYYKNDAEDKKIVDDFLHERIKLLMKIEYYSPQSYKQFYKNLFKTLDEGVFDSNIEKFTEWMMNINTDIEQVMLMIKTLNDNLNENLP